MQFNGFVVLWVEITNVKIQIKEKLSFAYVLKSVESVVNKLKEMNIMKNSGRQIETAI